MKSRSTIFLVAATLALGCSPDGPLPNEPVVALSSATVKMVPFHAKNTGAAVDASAVSCPQGAIAAKNLVSGTGTHLGNFTGENTSCFAFDTPLTAHFVSGETTLIAANGDQLWQTLVNGQIVIELGPGGSATLTITAAWDIIGGTGRFDGATGYANTFSARDLNAPPVLETTAGGMISAPGSINWSN